MHREFLVQIIDDDKNLSDLLRRLLEKKGFRVVVARNGEEGLEQLNQIVPDLIVLDINMPKMSGLEVYKNILTCDDLPRYPVIVMTSRTEFTGLFRDAHAESFIAKPFTIQQFDSEIQKIFARPPQPAVLLADFTRSVLVRNTVQKLASEGFKTTRFSTTTEFRKTVDAQKPDVMIIEILPHDATGEQTIHFIRSYQPFQNIPVIAYAFAQEGADRFKKAKILVSRFLENPAQVGDFVEAVKAVVTETSKSI